MYDIRSLNFLALSFCAKDLYSNGPEGINYHEYEYEQILIINIIK